MPSEIMVEKLQAANKSRIGQLIGSPDERTMRALARSLTIALGLAQE